MLPRGNRAGSHRSQTECLESQTVDDESRLDVRRNSGLNRVDYSFDCRATAGIDPRRWTCDPRDIALLRQASSAACRFPNPLDRRSLSRDLQDQAERAAWLGADD